MPEAPAAAPAAVRAEAASGRRRRRWAAAIALAVLLAAWVAASNLYLVSTARGSIVADAAAAPARPAALVLGNYISPAGVPSRELTRRLDAGEDAGLGHGRLRLN